jgi:hypothetical protein
MKMRTIPVGLLLAALAGFLAACGDGPDTPATPILNTSTPSGATSAASGVASPTPALGPAPTLGRYVLSITPGHGEKVTRESTKTLNPARPQGLCFTADFTEAPEQAQWFRIAFDGQEVTTKLTWIVSTGTASDKQGRACYAVAEGLSVGRHTAAISVQDPKALNQPARQTVAWAFDVTP